VNILIVKTSAIGDVIHTLPSLWSLRAHFPEAQITWLVEESAADLVIGHPALNRVLVARRKNLAEGLACRPVLPRAFRIPGIRPRAQGYALRSGDRFPRPPQSAMWVVLARECAKPGSVKAWSTRSTVTWRSTNEYPPWTWISMPSTESAVAQRHWSACCGPPL
jgi:hypothetical protein